ncbi:MAG: response regulator [Nitrospinae bacterium]|nr:response regulator [Nitrospinota bacterium]
MEDRLNGAAGQEPRVALVAEDSPDDRLLIEEAAEELREQDGIALELVFVEDGEQALAFLNQEGAYAGDERVRRMAMAFFDINMPRLSGVEAAREVRASKTWDWLPVVMFSTSRNTTDVMESYRVGASAYVVKPMSAATFISTVRAVFRHWLSVTRDPEKRKGNGA